MIGPWLVAKARQRIAERNLRVTCNTKRPGNHAVSSNETRAQNGAPDDGQGLRQGSTAGQTPEAQQQALQEAGAGQSPLTRSAVAEGSPSVGATAGLARAGW
jgi:hypothetical protein